MEWSFAPCCKFLCPAITARMGTPGSDSGHVMLEIQWQTKGKECCIFLSIYIHLLFLFTILAQIADYPFWDPVACTWLKVLRIFASRIQMFLVMLRRCLLGKLPRHEHINGNFCYVSIFQWPISMIYLHPFEKIMMSLNSNLFDYLGTNRLLCRSKLCQLKTVVKNGLMVELEFCPMYCNVSLIPKE